MNGRYQITYYPATLTRIPSYVNIKDLDTEETRTFTEKKVLGKGEYGFVREFTDGKTSIAVKSPNEKYVYSRSEKEAEYRRLRVNAEYSLMCTAYPEKTLCYMTDVLGKDKTRAKKDEPKYHYSYRIVDEFIPGQTLYSFLKDFRFTSTEQFVRLVLRIAEALQTIHNNHVIHGDVAGRNIMLEEIEDDFKVRFIDFGLGYKLNGNAITGFYDTSDYGEMAPERMNGKRLPADPVQDVYSFAYLVNLMFNENLNHRMRRNCERQYPAIISLIEDGMRKDPSIRPDLPGLIIELRYALDWYIVSRHLFDLAIALEDADKKGFTRANRLMQSNPELYNEEDLTLLLTSLIERNEYKIACHLIDFVNNTIPINPYMLYAAAENPDIHEDFLLELITSLAEDEARDILTATPFNKNTLLHAAAIAGRMDNVHLLMEHGLDLLQKNGEGLLPADVADASIKPLLKLLTFIAKCEKQQQHRGRLFHAKRDTQISSELETARYLLEIVNNDKIKPKLDDHLTIIMESRELYDIYQGLVSEGMIQAPARGILDIVSDYFKFGT